jgi:hypothetical protein
MIYSEVETLLSELVEVREQLAATEHTVQKYEHDLFESNRTSEVIVVIDIITYTSLT